MPLIPNGRVEPSWRKPKIPGHSLDGVLERFRHWVWADQRRLALRFFYSGNYVDIVGSAVDKSRKIQACSSHDDDAYRLSLGFEKFPHCRKDFPELIGVDHDQMLDYLNKPD